MRPSVQVENEILRVQVPGERFEARDCPELRHEIASRWQSEIQILEIDCQHLRWIDSSAFGTLLTLYRLFETSHGMIRLRGVSPQIHSQTQLLRLDRLFHLDESVAT